MTRISRALQRALILVALTAAALTVGLLAGIPTASAHVHVDADQTVPGEETMVTFQVPNESETGSLTTQLAVTLPAGTSAAGELVPGWTVKLDRDAMARLGVTTQAVDDTLYDAYGQRQVASYFTQINVYRTILEVDPGSQLDENALEALYVPSSTGLPVPLSAIVSTLRSTRSTTSLSPLTSISRMSSNMNIRWRMASTRAWSCATTSSMSSANDPACRRSALY